MTAVLKFLHILFMFGAVTLFVGTGVAFQGVARTGDVRAIRRYMEATHRLDAPAGVVFVLGIVLGFVAALVGDLDLTAPWLLIAYGLVVGILALGALYHGPRDRRIREAVERSPR